MMNAVNSALPGDIFIAAAAVSDWGLAKQQSQKIKKQGASSAPTINLKENQDILKTVATAGENRPALVIGFAAETENLLENARTKLAAKGCDWILANDVSGLSDIIGGDENQVHLIKRSGAEQWPRMSKIELGKKLADEISLTFINNSTSDVAGDVS